jgi:F-type H+-transporting ATPase subunit delta
LTTKILQAKRFSQAIFEIAQERNEFDKWQSDLHRIASLAQNSEFVLVMENPKFPFGDKTRLLDSQLKGVNPMALNLANILTNQGKFGLISDIYAEYEDLLNKHRGIEKAEVTTAVPLDEKEKAELAERIGKMTGKKIVMKINVNPKIIGGVIARVGDKIIDGSTLSQLNALKSEIESAKR